MGNRLGAMVIRRAAAVLVAGMGFAGIASATLLDRGPNLVYDDVLDITWTRHANLPGGSLLTWDEAITWAENLVFEGFDDWRLPHAGGVPLGPPCTGTGGIDEIACRANEMGYMFFYNLGGVEQTSKAGVQTALGGQVIDSAAAAYWSDTPFNNGFEVAYLFVFNFGWQTSDDRIRPHYTWAVRDGDVAAMVPEPHTLALLGLGLAGLGFRKRGKS